MLQGGKVSMQGWHGMSFPSSPSDTTRVNFVDVLPYARWCQVCGVKPGEMRDELLGV